MLWGLDVGEYTVCNGDSFLRTLTAAYWCFTRESIIPIMSYVRTACTLFYRLLCSKVDSVLAMTETREGQHKIKLFSHENAACRDIGKNTVCIALKETPAIML
jgi:hypothetical protein